MARKRSPNSSTTTKNGTMESKNGTLHNNIHHENNEMPGRSFPAKDCFQMLGVAAVLIFSLPFTAYKISPTPRTDLLWWQNGIVYSINMSKSASQDIIQDISSNVEYMSTLGINATYLDGFYETFTHIEPTQNSPYIKDLSALASHLHTKGLKLIVDFIPNHVHRSHPWFVKSETEGNSGSYADYFIWSPAIPKSFKAMCDNCADMWEFHYKRKQYVYHGNLPHHPDLNLRNHKVKMLIFEHLQLLLSTGIDGIVIKHVDILVEPDTNDTSSGKHRRTVPTIADSIKLCHEFKALINKSNKDIYMAVDVAGDIIDISQWSSLHAQSGAHMVLSRPHLSHTEHCNGVCWGEIINELLDGTPQGYSHNWMIQHPHLDTPRLNTLLATLPGLVFVESGSEVGRRDTYPWNVELTPQDKDTLSQFRHLASFRHIPAIQWGWTKVALSNQHYFSFIRHAKGFMYYKQLVVINVSDKEEIVEDFIQEFGKVKVRKTGLVTVASHSRYSIGDQVSLGNVTVEPNGYVVIGY